jgi:hypothetical protein
MSRVVLLNQLKANLLVSNLRSANVLQAGLRAVQTHRVLKYRSLPLAGIQMGPSTTPYPPRMFDAIARDRESGVILASPDFGGAITWRLQPGFRAVLDDSNNLVGEGYICGISEL